jgi:hypothetical protein
MTFDNSSDDRHVSPPWWAKRVRHGSLFTKRVKHWLSLAAVGIVWFSGDVLNLFLEWLGPKEKWFRGWCDWISGVCALPSKAFNFIWYWGSPPAPPPPTFAEKVAETPIVELVSIADAIGDVIFWIVLAWTLFWVYCDAVCTAVESGGGDVHQRTRNHFLTTAAWAAFVSLATYIVAWEVFKWLGFCDLIRQASPV